MKKNESHAVSYIASTVGGVMAFATWIPSTVRKVLRHDSPSLLAVGQLGITASSLVSAPVVARAIGPSGRGETAAALALFYIVPVALALGMPLEARRRGATSDPAIHLRTGRLVTMMLTVPALAVAVAAYLTIFASMNPSTRWIASIGVVAAPASVSWLFDLGMLIVQSRYSAVFAIKITQPSIYLVGVVVLWVVHAATPGTVLLVNIAGSVATSVVGAALTRVSLRGPRSSIRQLLAGGRRFAGGAIADIASNKLDQVLVLPILGASQAGIYAVSSMIGGLPLVLGQALAGSYFVKFARTPREESQVLHGEAARAAVAVGALTAVGLAAVSVVLVPLFFGHAFESAVPVVWIYLVGSVALVANYVLSMSLAAGNRGRMLSSVQLSGLAIAVVSLLFLGHVWGSRGAAAASSVGYWALFLMYALTLRLRPEQLLPRPRDLLNGVLFVLKPR